MYTTRSGCRRGNDSRERAGELAEIVVVARAVGELDVQSAGHFVERIVSSAVHAEREHSLVVGKDCVGAVPLMHVEIDDRRTRHAAFPLQHANRHGDVVEHAKAFAVVGERVVRSAGEVHGDPVRQRVPRRVERAGGRAIRSFDQCLGPGKAEAPHFVGRHLTAREPIDVVRAMDEEQIVARRAVGLVHAVHRHRAVRDDAVAE